MNRKRSKSNTAEETRKLKMFLVPCSCGTTFAVTQEYDHKGTHIRSFIPCPSCGKRHDPKNRLLKIGYEPTGFWKVDEC